LKEYEFHELANEFPLLGGDGFDGLVNDIREHGLREPIWLYEGKILDGRNRYRACQKIGIEPDTREYEGDGLEAFVLSLNLHRRHLTTSQRALLAAKQTNLTHGGQRGDKDQGANLPDGSVSSANAAEALNVSERIVKTARTVQENGSPELVEAVEKGDVSVSKASEISKKVPKERQKEAVEDKLPTPKQANQQARKNGTKVLASDLRYHDGRTPEQNEAEKNVTKIMFQCFEALEFLATMKVSAAQLVEIMDDSGRYRIDNNLGAATDFITELNKIWRAKDDKAA